jgi:exopolyphosphatase / guanosine-5'-triphosphate,3'-diphosphate pyrophosphatase
MAAPYRGHNEGVAKPHRAEDPRQRVGAAIDIGTNSIHLVVARAGDGGRFEVLTREKESVRLGHGSGDMRRLDADAIERGITALRRFRQLADVHDAQITAVATSAVREAANRDEFIRRARDEAGIEVEVISGVEEARLIHLGVLQAVPVYERRHLVVDIGGGSTEVVVAERDDVHVARSVKLGAIRLTDRFFPGGAVRPEAVEACRGYVRSYLAPLAREILEWGFDVAVGSSGTITSAAAMVQHARGLDTSRGVNNVAFRRDELHEVVQRLTLACTSQERRCVPGLDARRADIIVGGLVLLEELFDQLGIDTMIASEYALREGVLLSQARDHGHDAFHHLSDIRRSGVQRMLQLFERDRVHVEHATDLALRIFDETAAAHQLGPDERDLLEAGGMLHNVGLFISHAAHHKHSYYVIRNSDQLVGFTDHEIEIMSQVARYHRKGAPTTRQPEFAALDQRSRRIVSLLAGMLRLGIALDRTHANVVHDVQCRLVDTRVDITAIVRAGSDPALEMYTAEQRKGPLEQALGLRIEVTASRDR